MLEFEFRLCLRTFRVRNLLLKKKKKRALKKCWFSCAAFVSSKFTHNLLQLLTNFTKLVK